MSEPKVIENSDVLHYFIYELPFKNRAGTLVGIARPDRIQRGKLDEREIARLRVDIDQNGIRYVVLSYDTPILWITNDMWVYKVEQYLGEATELHKKLLGK